MTQIPNPTEIACKFFCIATVLNTSLLFTIEVFLENKMFFILYYTEPMVDFLCRICWKNKYDYNLLRSKKNQYYQNGGYNIEPHLPDFC